MRVFVAQRIFTSRKTGMKEDSFAAQEAQKAQNDIREVELAALVAVPGRA